MSLTLGRKLDRCYNLRIPFSGGFYDIGVFFHKKTTFLLFKVDPNFSNGGDQIHGSKITMYKNLQSSKFCETFIELYSFRSDSLDISNQFKQLKDELCSYVVQLFNEVIIIDRFKVDDKVFNDTLSLFGFSLDSSYQDFIFVIAERQNINTKIGKKIVRTTGLQIATSKSISLLDDFYEDTRTHGKIYELNKFPTNDSITIE